MMNTGLAAIEVYDFETTEQEQRFKTLTAQMRCPMCLNSNIAGSDAQIASDLRAEVHRQILEGKTDKEIMDFMTVRYGDFINYKPPLNKGTFLLWFGPVFLLLIGFFVVFRMLKRNSGTETVPLAADEQEQLEKLLEAADKES